MEKLIERCKRGDINAQKELYERFAPYMLSVCVRYVKNREAAEDLLHDGFIKIFRKINTYQGTGAFEGWMRKLFVNTSLEYLRKNDVLRYSMDAEELVSLSSENYSVIEQINADELHQLIASLPTGFRTVFNMYAVEGYSHAEIAEELGISEGTSRSQYARARGALQKLVLKKYQ